MVHEVERRGGVCARAGYPGRGSAGGWCTRLSAEGQSPETEGNGCTVHEGEVRRAVGAALCMVQLVGSE